MFETRLKHVWNCLKPKVFETKEKVFICVWNANLCYICQQWTWLFLMKWYMKYIICELRIWNQVKLWSSQLWTQFLQLRREAWKIQDFNGVWTHDLVIPLRRSNQLSYEATDVGSWSFVSSNVPVRNESMMKWHNYEVLWTQFLQLRREAWKMQLQGWNVGFRVSLNSRGFLLSLGDERSKAKNLKNELADQFFLPLRDSPFRCSKRVKKQTLVVSFISISKIWLKI